MIKVELDANFLTQLINEAVETALKRYTIQSSYPPVLNKQQFMEFLDIGSTKAAELFNRKDFPVCRELGHPRVKTDLLLQWIEQHTEWVATNAGNNAPARQLNGVA